MSQHLLCLLQVLDPELVLVQLVLLLFEGLLDLSLGLLKLLDADDLVLLEDLLESVFLLDRLLGQKFVSLALLLNAPNLPADGLYVILQSGNYFLELKSLGAVHLAEIR